MILDCHIYLESTSYLFENLFHTAVSYLQKITEIRGGKSGTIYKENS